MSLPPIARANLGARFARLGNTHSNQCGLAPGAIASLPAGGRLQGSCCNRMDRARYFHQVDALGRYARLDEAPRDPYDVSVKLARRLVGYERTIALTGVQQAIYRSATALAREHGPCCCHCWRWNAFEGQGRELLARRNLTARRLASLWDLEDGCG